MSLSERWQSGLTRTPGKREWTKIHRGFESPPLRQFKTPENGITHLADQIQCSAPGVLGGTSPHRDRNVTGITRWRVDALIIGWVKERKKG